MALSKKLTSLIVILTCLAVLILIVANIFLALNLSQTRKELQAANNKIESQKQNEQVLVFTKFFIAKVLRTDSEVDFETRLRLENLVRNLNDDEVLAQWNKFTEAEEEEQAQKEVKILLEMLVNRIGAQ